MEKFTKALALEGLTLSLSTWIELLVPGFNPVILEAMVFLGVWLPLGSRTLRGFTGEVLLTLLGTLLPGIGLLGELGKEEEVE